MKSLKVCLALVTLSLFASAPLAHAQEKKGAMSPEQRIERIEHAVGTLTADQKAKIKDILTAAQEEMRNTPKEERKSKMTETNQKVRAVLTPEQQKKFDEMPQGGPGGGKKKKQQN
jgi:Spy/CpxP family protein refolding chaperone